MEHISIKLESGIAKQIDKSMREFNYSTKTEFIRDAIRAKLRELNEERKKKRAWDALFAAKGIFKGKGKFESDGDFYKWRKEYGAQRAKELAEEYGLKI
ncbi:MAG: ribbon-helix-helix domain-containing protein [Candidatus Diapherotrites archaeon]|nr:ribbon-helix-helix domain-containing protein [Candidatus Micrarchaeota archaeon]MBU1939360.1 ribbon-helix-helix domain-containing protein [Candidatus Micrarchaeota archaeon]